MSLMGKPVKPFHASIQTDARGPETLAPGTPVPTSATSTLAERSLSCVLGCGPHQQDQQG